MPQHFFEADALRPQLSILPRHQTREVDGEVLLQGGVLVEIRHHHFGIGVRLDVHSDAETGFLVGFVGEAQELW